MIGIERDDTAIAPGLDELVDAGVLEVELDGRNPVVWVESGTRSALDSGAISEGREVGATGVFGTAVDGPLEGTQLDAVVHVDTFWFAWGSFQPDTRIEP